MRKIPFLLVLALAACGGGNTHAPAPLPKIALPKGTDLKPYDPARPGSARPYGMAQLGGKLYVALGNLRADYSVAGPGYLAGVVPSQGVTDVIDLGGQDERLCQNPATVRADAGRLYVSCGGDFGSGSGRALVEVDPGTQKVSRSLAVPQPYGPSGIALASARLWMGTTNAATLISLDRASFTLVDGSAMRPPISLTCPQHIYAYVPDLAVVGNDLYALCATDVGGILYRLDAATGSVLGQANVGAIPTALAATGDGRVAVLCSGDSTLWLATPGAGGSLTAALGYTYGSNTSALQDVHASGGFLFTTASLSNTVQKIDLSGTLKVIAEVNTGASTAPWSVLPLDADQAVVSDSLSDDLAGVDFRTAAK